MSDFKEGLYDQLVTRHVREFLDLQAAQGLKSSIEELEENDYPDYLARHLIRQIKAVLRSVPAEDRKRRQIELANTLLDFARTQETSIETDAVDQAGQVLRAIYSGAVAPVPPSTPLSVTSLLMNALDEPRLGFELEREMATADRVLMVVSFVQWRGWQRLKSAFHLLAERNVPIRLLTTTYIGATDFRAIEELSRLPNVELRISLDGRRRRLHAKAWLFQRDNGFSSIYVGSANLSGPALEDGIEWTVKLSEVEAPHIVGRFRGAFDFSALPQAFQANQSDAGGLQSIGSGASMPPIPEGALMSSNSDVQQDVAELNRLSQMYSQNQSWKTDLAANSQQDSDTALTAAGWAALVSLKGPADSTAAVLGLSEDPLSKAFSAAYGLATATATALATPATQDGKPESTVSPDVLGAGGGFISTLGEYSAQSGTTDLTRSAGITGQFGGALLGAAGNASAAAEAYNNGDGVVMVDGQDAGGSRPVRRWRTLLEKRRIAELTLEPGASVALVARAHGVNANQVFKWRRALKRGELSEPAAALTSLLPVVVTAPGEAVSATGEADAKEPSVPGGSIHIEFPGRTSFQQ
jgi:HKD family nuclease/transposase-like protein